MCVLHLRTFSASLNPPDEVEGVYLLLVWASSVHIHCLMFDPAVSWRRFDQWIECYRLWQSWMLRIHFCISILNYHSNHLLLCNSFPLNCSAEQFFFPPHIFWADSDGAFVILTNFCSAVSMKTDKHRSSCTSRHQARNTRVEKQHHRADPWITLF